MWGSPEVKLLQVVQQTQYCNKGFYCFSSLRNGIFYKVTTICVMFYCNNQRTTHAIQDDYTQHTMRLSTEEVVVLRNVGDDTQKVRHVGRNHVLWVQQRRDSQLRLRNLKSLLIRENEWVLYRHRANTMVPQEFFPACERARIQRTHQLVILINISSGERVEISRVKREWQKIKNVTNRWIRMSQIMDYHKVPSMQHLSMKDYTLDKTGNSNSRVPAVWKVFTLQEHFGLSIML